MLPRSHLSDLCLDSGYVDVVDVIYGADLVGVTVYHTRPYFAYVTGVTGLIRLPFFTF